MSDDDDCDYMNVPAETPLSPEEAIIRRHRREKRDLQGKIQSMKKNVNKADKKKKKELADEVIRLEEELNARHKAELDAFRPGKLVPLTSVPQTVTEAVEEPSSVELVTEQPTENGEIGSAPGTPKMSKARKRREKKEAEEREKQKRIQEESSVLLESSQMKAEDDIFTKMMKDLKLAIVEIEPDGNCLYNAVKDQLKRQGESIDTQSLRSQTADYLRKHKDEFIAFMDEEHSSSGEKFEEYCKELESTPAWGGQLEVRILSQILKRPIKVLQATGQPVVFGEQFSTNPLILTYHRHKYQLGEHYNSATAATAS